MRIIMAVTTTRIAAAIAIGIIWLFWRGWATKLTSLGTAGRAVVDIKAVGAWLGFTMNGRGVAG